MSQMFDGTILYYTIYLPEIQASFGFLYFLFAKSGNPSSLWEQAKVGFFLSSWFIHLFYCLCELIWLLLSFADLLIFQIQNSQW